MNIFGFKLNWRALKSEELSRVTNFLATHMTEKELAAEKEKIEREFPEANEKMRFELNKQNEILWMALVTKKFTRA